MNEWMGVLALVVLLQVFPGGVNEGLVQGAGHAAGIAHDDGDGDTLFHQFRCCGGDIVCGVVCVLIAVKNILAAVIRVVRVCTEDADLSPVKACAQAGIGKFGVYLHIVRALLYRCINQNNRMNEAGQGRNGGAELAVAELHGCDLECFAAEVAVVKCFACVREFRGFKHLCFLLSYMVALLSVTMSPV